MRKHRITEAPPPLPEPEFSFTLARVAVSQICQSIGFNGARSPALVALTDVAIRYLRLIAKLSAESAISNGRTQSNVFDIVYALEELASVQGFPGCSSVRSRRLLMSAVIRDLIEFVKFTDEIPFAQPLPPRRLLFNKGSFSRYKDCSRWYGQGGLKHVPRWLPALPPLPVEGNEERRREVRWECLKEREENWECGERKTVERELHNEREITEKRGKVRFKIGVGLDRKSRDDGRMVCAGTKRPGPITDEEEEGMFIRKTTLLQNGFS